MDGTPIVNPIFDSVERFKDGFAAVCLNGKWGYIKADGSFLVKPMFDNPFHEDYDGLDDWYYERYNNNFHKDIALIKLNGKFGFLKSDGSYLAIPQYDDTVNFNRTPLVPVEIDGKWGYLNVDGSYMIDPIFDGATPFYTELPESDVRCSLVILNGKYGILKSDGEYLAKPIFDKIYVSYYNLFSDRYIRVCINGKWGLLKPDGTYLIHPLYDEIYDRTDGFNLHYFDSILERVRLQDKCGYIDIEGNWYDDETD